jgi:hypothetical protein
MASFYILLFFVSIGKAPSAGPYIIAFTNLACDSYWKKAGTDPRVQDGM